MTCTSEKSWPLEVTGRTRRGWMPVSGRAYCATADFGTSSTPQTRHRSERRHIGFPAKAHISPVTRGGHVQGLITPRPGRAGFHPASSGSCPGVASASWTGIRVPSGLTARTGALTSRTPRSFPAGDVHVPSNCHDIRHDRWTSVAAQGGVAPPRGRSSKRRRGPAGTRRRVPLVPPHCT